MTWALIATLCGGLFAGAAVYINVVEHPARMRCGVAQAVQEFGPSYQRATLMQASLATIGLLSGIVAWLQLQDPFILVGAVSLGIVVPFTLLIIAPINRQLLDPNLDRTSRNTKELLLTWGKLHAVRSALSLIGFLILLTRIGRA